jgi:succinate dehydrogenase / fumarate reductase iron-sulfur subunit/fumarate reductase iron-sulfur subunit
VRRSEPGAPGEFVVSVGNPVTVLDVLTEIQRTHDPSLAFRFSCRVAMCGTCAVRVDGRSTLACRAVLEPAVDALDIAPLAGLPVVRDLIVDTRPFWAEWARVKPWFVPIDDGVDATHGGGAPTDVVDRTLGCISCGACYSTCEVARHDGDYLGPAALNRALALIADPRDGAAAERLEIVGGPGGVDRCHYIGGCTGACPVGLDPSRSIVELRRLRLARRG